MPRTRRKKTRDGSAGTRRNARGSILPFVLVGLTVLAALVLAGIDAADFAAAAARAQADGVAALHAADSGLDLYVAGVGPENGPLSIDAPPGEASVTVTPLLDLADASRLVHVTSEGRAPAAAARPVARGLGLVVHLEAGGARRRVVGSWREIH